MNFNNGTTTCTAGCPTGFSSNGTASKTCVKCDVSCLTCRENGIAGDASRCD
jgi:hypothetical protein